VLTAMPMRAAPDEEALEPAGDVDDIATLSPAARKIWDEGIASGAFPDRPSQAMLVRFCRLQDQIRDADAKILVTGGAVIRNRFGEPKPNPWVKIRLELIRESCRVFRLLGWDQEPRGGQQGDLFWPPAR